MKVVLGHCYSTENKGDAAIVLATIATIRQLSPHAELIGMSTFSSRDEAFVSHHEDYKEAGARMVPALLPEDKLFLFGRVLTSPLAKALSFIKNLYLLVQGLALFRVNPAFAMGDVGNGLAALNACELFVSKGGSFLCNEGGMRGDISLFKLLVPFWVAKRSGARTIILAQSIGPFNSGLSRAMFRFFMRYIDRIYLREDRCLRYLAHVPPHEMAGKIDFCPDMAFALSSSGFQPIAAVGDGQAHIGLTIVNHHFAADTARRAYVDVVGNTVALFAKRFPGTCFHVFPQVINKQADGGEDAMLAREVAAYCERRHGIALDLIEGDFDARTLQQSYARMRYFVATRLHSSIFAASAGVPTIVFGYHGTKAEGIWHDLGFDDLFFDINALHWPEVERSLETLIRQERDISTKLLGRTREWREKITEVVRNELAHFS